MFYVGSLSKMFPKRPKVDLTGYKPRTGEFMVGIKTYGCEHNTLHCKEYIQTRLLQPLEADKNYYFEYWIQAIKPSVRVNSFGIAFTTERMQELMQTGVLDMYPVMMADTISNLEDEVWTRISGVFTAYDGFEYAIIGNFGADKSLEFEMKQNGIDYGYYLLDDVFVRPNYESIGSKILLNESIILGDVLFEFDKAKIQDSSIFQLNEIVEFLLSDTSNNFEIHGHTDSEGTNTNRTMICSK